MYFGLLLVSGKERIVLFRPNTPCKCPPKSFPHQLANIIHVYSISTTVRERMIILLKLVNEASSVSETKPLCSLLYYDTHRSSDMYPHSRLCHKALAHAVSWKHLADIKTILTLLVTVEGLQRSRGLFVMFIQSLRSRWTRFIHPWQDLCSVVVCWSLFPTQIHY